VERGVAERRVRGRGEGLRARGSEERAVAFPIAERAPQQAIPVAAITEQTTGQHTKAIQARDRASRKQRNTRAKPAAFASVAPREPLKSMALEEVEQYPGGHRSMEKHTSFCKVWCWVQLLPQMHSQSLNW
jgi:hypothetical protein